MAANDGSVEISEADVTQFCAVTGGDEQTARRLLEICRGNVEMAIGTYLDGTDDTGPIDNSVASGSNNSVASGSGLRPNRRSAAQRTVEPGAASMAAGEFEDMSGVRAPIPQRHEQLVEDVPKLPAFRRGMRRVRPTSVFDGFRDFQAEAREQESLMLTGRSISNKKSTLEDLFRPPIDLTFKGSFVMARDSGVKQNKWLMVNVQNVQEFVCQVLNRDVWSDPTIKQLLKKSFVFWQVYHDGEEGRKYMQFYKIQNWPHVAVIDPITGESLVSWNKIDIASFPDVLREFLNDHPCPKHAVEPPAKRVKRSDSILDANEEAQLEAAIQASLTQTQLALAAAKQTAAGSDVDSEDLDSGSDDLETFTGSEDESNDGPVRTKRGGSKDRTATPEKRNAPSEKRNFSAVSSAQSSGSRGNSHAGGRGGRRGRGAVATSLGSGASGTASSPRRHLLRQQDSPVPSTSGSGTSSNPTASSSRSLSQVALDSENESSQGFRESLANTPNSVEIMGGRSSECHIVDSSSNSSSSGGGVVGGSLSASTLDLNSVPLGRLQAKAAGGMGDGDEELSSSGWKQHLGDDSDPVTNLVIRFPDGKKEQLSIPCSSTLEALFAFCTEKGFSQKSYELVVNFPRRSISNQSASKTLKEVNLHPQETIFVQAR